MINSKLSELLRSFSRKEFKEFGNFVTSPFFNKNENVIRLYAYIKKFHPEFTDNKLSKEVVFRKIFGKSDYNDGYMRTLIFNLYNLAEEYISWKTFSDNRIRKNMMLLENFNDRNLDRLFLKKFEETENLINEVKFRDEEYFRSRILIHYQMELFIEANRFKRKDYNKFRDHSYSFLSENLADYFYIMALKNYTLLFEDNMNRDKTDSEKFLNDTVDYILKMETRFDHVPIIKLRRLEILLYKEKSEKYFFELKEIFINENSKYSYNEMVNLHNILHFYARDKMFEGRTEYREERFELYKTALRHKIYSQNENDYFDELLFGNIVILAANLSKFEWAEKFITDHRDLLSPEIRNSCVNLSLARLSFARKNYDKTIFFINQIGNIDNISYKTTIKELLMLSFYESGAFNELPFLIDSYNHFISKNKKNLTDLHYLRVRNFVKYFSKLFRLREKFNKDEFNKLKEELEKNTNTIERTWLIKKTEELI